MTTTLVTLTGDVSDAIGADYDPRRTKVYVRHNTPKVVTDSGPIHLGGGTVNVGSDGTFSLPNVVASTSLVENLQATVYVDYADSTTRQRTVATFGPYDLSAETGTVDIRDLEAVQALDPSFASEMMAAMQVIRDDVEAIAGLPSEAAAQAYNIEHDPAVQAALSASIADAADPHLLDAMPRPLILAHRGGLLVYPEESMEAFRAAAAGGYILEMDLRPLSDGTLVLCHDATVTRTMTGISGNVSANTPAAWQSARVKPVIGGGRTGTPATWRQILDEFGGRAVMCIEFKETCTDAQIISVYDDLEARNLKRSVIMQASGVGTSSSQALARGFEFMVVPSDTSNDPATLKAMGINYISPGGAAANATYVGQCAAAGLIVTPYTFDTSTDLAEKLGWGAHGIITNDPWGVTRYYQPKTVEKFDSGYAWPNADAQNLSPTLQYLDVAGGYTLGDGNNGAFYRRLGQFSKGPMIGRFQFDIQFQAYGLNQARFAAIFIGHKASDLAFADGIKSDDTAATTQGYHFLIRRSGSKEIFNIDGAAKASLASHASAVDSFGPVGAVGPLLTFEVAIDAANVTLKCLTDGTQVTVAHATHRYTDAFLNLGNNGTQVRFKEIRVQR